LFRWDGSISQEEEILLMVKTRVELFGRLVAAVQAVHPYDVPEIIALPVLMGNKAYLEWIEEETEEE
jgi:periplasmic divalent cation tolerance protein